MASNKDIIAQRRIYVNASYLDAKENNRLRFLEGDVKATSEYIYPNQIEDANNIVNLFYTQKVRVISVQKKTKVGADGLMIEIPKLLTCHIDDEFVVNVANIRIITGMSNVGWEKDIIDKAPTCFKSKIFHHGKLNKTDIKDIRNGLIIIDEIDAGDKEYQKLHTKLKEAGVLDVKHMQEYNNRFVFISATPIKELYDLYRWGDLHELYKMTIPNSYIGHKDFLEKGIIKEFYPLMTAESAEKWINEDIISNYGKDFRVHIVRVKKNMNILQNACIKNNILFRIHTSTDRLTTEELNELFKAPMTQHLVIIVIGFYRRADFIPNSWKFRIGAVHEFYTKKVDNNVQIQGLVGRMTGYWKDIIENGHKTGPYRMSIVSIEEYERSYEDPFGNGSYKTSGFSKKNGKITAGYTMLSVRNIKNLEPIDLPEVHEKGAKPIIVIDNLNENDISIIKEKNIEKIKHLILDSKRPEILIEYASYEFHIWMMDTPDKCEKWGLKRMSIPGAYSTGVNTSNKSLWTVMMYLYEIENKLFISPWDATSSIIVDNS